MTLLYRDPRFLEHETGSHPERALRLRTVEAHLDRTWLAAQCRQLTAEAVRSAVAWPGFTSRPISRRFGPSPARAAAIWMRTRFAARASFDVAALAAGTVVDAVRRVVGGEDSTALCLVRPPGHHALAGQAMGFCIFNNVAVGAAAAIEEFGLDRVLIVDFDVHHGNGTQAIFWEDPRVGFLSIHRWPFYPGTGSADERGGGDGWGTTVNLPIEEGTSRDEYLRRLFRPIAVFCRLYPSATRAGQRRVRCPSQRSFGQLGVGGRGLRDLTNRILEVAAVHAGGRVVSVLEGGYNPPALAQCVEEHLGRLVEFGK